MLCNHFPCSVNVDLQNDTENTLLERELAITASHISDWEQLAHSLNVAECMHEIQEKCSEGVGVNAVSGC